MGRSGWPNLFIVGAARAGTTSLWHALGQHPGIYMSPVKEPWFFSREQIAHAPFPKDEDAYLGLFEAASDARWRGEASTSYLWDDAAAPRIKQASPDGRILVSLREPSARAYSSYWFAVRHGGEGRSFVDVLKAELAERDHPEKTEAGHIGQGHYVDDLDRYLRLFGDNVHVLFFEEFVADPRRELKRIFEFLEVDPCVVEELDLAAQNVSRPPRSPLLRRVLGLGPARALGRAVVPPALRPRAERLVRGGVVPSVDADAAELLQSVYAPDHEQLEHLLGRPLPWPRSEATQVQR